jgi:hypothetical protein
MRFVFIISVVLGGCMVGEADPGSADQEVGCGSGSGSGSGSCACPTALAYVGSPSTVDTTNPLLLLGDDFRIYRRNYDGTYTTLTYAAGPSGVRAVDFDIIATGYSVFASNGHAYEWSASHPTWADRGQPLPGMTTVDGTFGNWVDSTGGLHMSPTVPSAADALDCYHYKCPPPGSAIPPPAGPLADFKLAYDYDYGDEWLLLAHNTQQHTSEAYLLWYDGSWSHQYTAEWIDAADYGLSSDPWEGNAAPFAAFAHGQFYVEVFSQWGILPNTPTVVLPCYWR